MYKDSETFFKRYKLKTYDGAVYRSGKACGKRLVFETDRANLQLFDVSDVLFPKFITYLPQDKNLVPRPRGCTHTYVCISDTHIVIPFVEKGFLSGVEAPNTYLVVYNLKNTYYTMLVYKYSIGNVKTLNSIVITKFLGFNYLYIYADTNLIIMKGFDNFLVSLVPEDKDIVTHNDKMTFTVQPKNCSTSSQNLTLNMVHTGLDLKSTVEKINLIVTDDEVFYRINLDDYFEGFRNNIKVLYPSNMGDKSFSEVLDSSLYNLTHSIVGSETYEIANTRFNYEQQKALLPLKKNNLYLYVDCKVFLYLQFSKGAANVMARLEHGIVGYITKVKHFHNYHIIPEDQSLGTVVVQYQINGQEEVIQFCPLNSTMNEVKCMKPFQYPLGIILNYFVYQSEDASHEDYFIVGSQSQGSHFSLIRFFKDVSCAS